MTSPPPRNAQHRSSKTQKTWRSTAHSNDYFGEIYGLQRGSTCSGPRTQDILK
jgi:hypothetical protein